ncbi:hypothetical protein D7Z26_07270 [Cohnella endophytica]|uniref:histidine kinase n=1 Tax=Cohnella endophytica TaxID=2419778 RepID=A0A494Y102_9BACL|nr:sensor histidine kinase [Cohnella endophytica]RKP55023.1 hypothetical protein D7Z26_07270 [Cohnella endophytica]
MRMIRNIFLISMLGIFLVPFTAAARASVQEGTLQLTDAVRVYPLNPYIEVLADEKGEWTLQDVLSPTLNKGFQSAAGKSSFGYTASVYWIRVAIFNDSARLQWELSLKNPLMNKVQVYGLSRTAVLNRNVPTFAIQLPQDQVSTLYIRSVTPDTMILPLKLSDQSSVYRTVHSEFLVLGFYYGAMLIIVICLFALFISTKNRAFLYYSLYILFYTWANYVWNGLAGEYSGTGLTAEKAGRTLFFKAPSEAYEFYFLLSVWFGCLFLRNVMSPVSYAPKIDGLLRWMIGACPFILFAIGSIYPYGMAPYLAKFKMAIIFLMIAIIMRCAWKGNRMAKYLAIAKTPLFLGIVVPSTLLSFGVLPDNLFTHYAIQFSSVAEFAITAIVVSKQLSFMRKGSDEAQHTLVETLERWNATLKETVATQTESLNRTNDMLMITETKRMDVLRYISQEVRSPLDHVQESIRRLLEPIETDLGRQEELLAVAFSKVQDINHYMDDLLELSFVNQEQDALQMVIFREWIEDIFIDFAKEIMASGRRCESVINPFDSDVDVWMEPYLMRRIIQNLVNNACEFTPPDGTITLQAGQRDNAVWIMVGDTGQGIGAEQLGRIFVRDPRDDDHQVNGIGLAMAKEIVERHGGEIRADSELRRGSRVYISLPVIAAE